MTQKKPLNFAQALRFKPGELSSTPEVDSHLIPEVDSHQANIPPSRDVDGVTSHQQLDIASHQLKVASYMAAPTPMVERRKATRKKVDSHQNQKVDSRRGDRHSTARTPFNNRLDSSIVKQIKHFCIEHKMEMQEFAELSAIHFMNTVASHQGEGVTSTLALDDRRLMMRYKTSPFIINLYLRYNPQNKWRPADDQAAERYNDKDVRLVELGIIQTQFNANFKRINSFQYYVPEIEQFLETPLGEETVEIMLAQHRRRWEKVKGQGTAE